MLSRVMVLHFSTVSMEIFNISQIDYTDYEAWSQFVNSNIK